jgi:hypothetical protein
MGQSHASPQNGESMPKSLPYLWLFLCLWLAISVLTWLPGDWNVNFDRGNGREIKFSFSLSEQLIISSITGLIGAAFGTVLARWVHLWFVSKQVPMG